jgi:heat shock protein HtpX
MKKVKFSKIAFIVARSWFSFFFGFFALLAVWLIAFLIVARITGPGVRLFAIGFAIAAVIDILMFIFNEPLVVRVFDCKRIYRREDNPKLWDAVQRMKKTSMRTRIYIIPSQGMNACAFGWGIFGMSAVAATEGLINKLSSEELSAVMSHELGHLSNKDIPVSSLMAISVMTIAVTGWLLMNVKTKDSGDKIWALVLIGAGLYFFGRILGFFLQMFVSRQREYAADALSANRMGSSGPLISALEKIVENPHMVSKKKGAALGFLCTADPEPDDVLSTHPSLEKRISALRNLER